MARLSLPKIRREIPQWARWVGFGLSLAILLPFLLYPTSWTFPCRVLYLTGLASRPTAQAPGPKGNLPVGTVVPQSAFTDLPPVGSVVDESAFTDAPPVGSVVPESAFTDNIPGPRSVQFHGQFHEFPAGTTDAEIAEALHKEWLNGSESWAKGPGGLLVVVLPVAIAVMLSLTRLFWLLELPGLWFAVIACTARASTRPPRGSAFLVFASLALAVLPLVAWASSGYRMKPKD